METKKCPYCGEEIMAVAKKCRHCGEWLQDYNKSSILHNDNNSMDHQDNMVEASKNLSASMLGSIALTVLGVTVIAIEFWQGFSSELLMIFGYILACYGVSQLLVLSSAKPKNVKINIIRVGTFLTTICLFDAGFIGLSSYIDIYISGWSILYCIVYPFAISLGICSAIYAITLNKSKQ